MSVTNTTRRRVVWRPARALASSGLEMSARSMSNAELPAPNGLAPDRGDEASVGLRIAAEEPARLLEQSEQPLQPEALHQDGCTARAAGEHVDGAADAHHER